MIAKTVVDVATQTATVDSCVWDTDVAVRATRRSRAGRDHRQQPPSAPRSYQHDLYLEDGAWKIGEQRELSRGPDGVNQCPPKP